MEHSQWIVSSFTQDHVHYWYIFTRQLIQWRWNINWPSEKPVYHMLASYPSVGLGPESQVGGGLRCGQAQVGKVGFSPLSLPPALPLPVPIHPPSWAALGRAAANCREGQARGCPPHPGGIPVTCQCCTTACRPGMLSIVHCTLHIASRAYQGILVLHQARVKIMSAPVHQGHIRGEWGRAPKTQAGCPAPLMHHGHSGGLGLLCTDAIAFAPWNIATPKVSKKTTRKTT